MRLISVEALLRLLDVKEDLDDPTTVERIAEILTPKEFTRVDGIVDLVFRAAADVAGEPDTIEPSVTTSGLGDQRPTGENVVAPAAAFHDACIRRIMRARGWQLVKRSRVAYVSADETIKVVCLVSQEYESGVCWYAFRPGQNELLQSATDGYVAFGYGSADDILLVPIQAFASHLEALNRTVRDTFFYWHVHISKDSGQFNLHLNRAPHRVSLSPYRL
jgi:hypothetical protein